MTVTPLVHAGGWTSYRQGPDDSHEADPVAAELIDILDAVDIPLVVVHHNFTIACFNRAAVEVFRLEPSDVGRSPSELDQFTGLPDLKVWCAQAIAAATPSRHDFSDRHKSFVLRVSPYTKGDGQPTGAVLTFTNVTAFRASLDQAIREREFTKAILNTVAEPLMVLGPDLRVQTANRAFYSMFQVSREQAQDIRITEFGNHAFDVPGLDTQLRETLAGNREFQPFEFDRDFPVIGRRTVTFVAHVLSLPNRPGRMLLIGLHDITERMKAEQIVRDSERRLRELVEALPAAVYTTDADGCITMFNKAAVELSGRVPQLGSDSWCVTWKLHWPDGRPMPHDECPMAVALKTGRPIRGVEAIAERPDGTRVWFEPYPTLLHDEGGQLVGAVNMLVDITERKQAEEVKQQLASIVENSHDAIVSKDLNGTITSWNHSAERLFGYTAEEAVGKPVTMLIPSERQDEEPRILERIRRGEQVEHYETVRRRKDGSLIDISLTVSPVRNAEGKIFGASKIARDITELKRAQEQQSMLLREMNHRIKNLFTIAGSMVALSARSARSPRDMASTIRGRLDALARAHELVLPTPGAISEPNRSTTVAALIQMICSPYRDAGGAERINIQGTDLPIGDHAVTGFALIVHELATNASKYGALSTSSGRVDVALSVRDGELQLTWKECGGPLVQEPVESKGFGTVLVRKSVEGQLAGQISYDWRGDGLTVRLSALLEKLAT